MCLKLYWVHRAQNPLQHLRFFELSPNLGKSFLANQMCSPLIVAVVMLYCMKSKGTLCSRNRSVCFTHKKVSLYSMSSLLLLQFCVLQSARELPNRCHLYLPLTRKCLLCKSCTQLPKHHGRGENMGIFFFSSSVNLHL